MVAELNRKHWLLRELTVGRLSELRSMGEEELNIKYRLRGIGASRSMGCAVRAGSAWGGWRALFNREKLPGEDVGVFYLDEVKVLSECMVGET